MEPLTVLIAADLFPTDANAQTFSAGDTERLVGRELIRLLAGADARVFNLEGPLTDRKDAIEKFGPALKAGSGCIHGIHALNPTLLSVANNHIFDYGQAGLEDTIELCRERNIPVVGAGNSLKDVKKHHILKLKKCTLGIYACAEHEFSIASEKRGGANPYDPLVCFDEVRQLKQECDYVVVLYHGGREEYRYPTPRVQKVFRRFAQAGADVVINQHSHCIGCMERFGGSVLVYGQGNFLFAADENEYWANGMLVRLTIADGLRTDFVPVVRRKEGVRLAQEAEAKAILDGFSARSEEICREGFVAETYEAYARKMVGFYAVNLAGRNILTRGLNKLTGGAVWKYLYSRSRQLALLNYVECESHAELLSVALRDNKQQK